MKMASRLIIDEEGNIHKGKLDRPPSMGRRNEPAEDDNSEDEGEHARGDDDQEDDRSKEPNCPRTDPEILEQLTSLKGRVEKLEEIIEGLVKKIEGLEKQPSDQKYKLYQGDQQCGTLEVGTDVVFDLVLTRHEDIKICKLGEVNLPSNADLSLTVNEKPLECKFCERKDWIYLQVPEVKNYPLAFKFTI